MGTHTPGPWKARCNQFSRWEIHYGKGRLANVSKPDDPASPPDAWAACEANARLIAAAPDLLAALQQIQRIGYSDIGDRMMVDAAIAKATGGNA